MQILTEPNKNLNLSLALGFFDGVHSGHKSVIESAVNYAHKNRNKSAVITFKDHPCCYFWSVPPKYILTKEEREKQIENLGVDFLYELDFESISGLTAEDYLKDVLVKYFTPVSISTGWNHHFGHNKTGDVNFLKQQAQKFGYKYFELPPQKLNNEVISSTAIRKLLSEGKIEKANLMLGKKFKIEGEVVTGNQIGRTIGFPTANLVYPPELIELQHGVYSVDVIVPDDNPSAEKNHSQKYKGIANFGTRPTLNGHNAVLEIHILNFNEDIYRQTISVEFNKTIRAEKKFNSLDALKSQINIDIKSI